MVGLTGQLAMYVVKEHKTMYQPFKAMGSLIICTT
jgi:hypothetical protein